LNAEAVSIRRFAEKQPPCFSSGTMGRLAVLARSQHRPTVIPNGAKPANLPVSQSRQFEFVINLAPARALGPAVPGDVISIADEVIE
jgi:hypothetical protein